MKTNTKIGLAVAVVLLLTVVVLGSNSRFFQGAFKAGQFKQIQQQPTDNTKRVNLGLIPLPSEDSKSEPPSTQPAGGTQQTSAPTGRITIHVAVNDPRGRGSLQLNEIPIRIHRAVTNEEVAWPRAGQPVDLPRGDYWVGSTPAGGTYFAENYAATSNWSGDCQFNGSFTLSAGDNKTCSRSFEYSRRPDLVTRVERPLFNADGTLRTLHGYIQNIGRDSVGTSGAMASFCLNSDEVCRYGDRPVPSYFVNLHGGLPDIGPGVEYYDSLSTFLFGADGEQHVFRSGTNTVTFCADLYGAVSESNEANNCSTLEFTYP